MAEALKSNFWNLKVKPGRVATHRTLMRIWSEALDYTASGLRYAGQHLVPTIMLLDLYLWHQ